VIFGNSATDRLGHWSKDSPVAVESNDGGLTFSRPVAPSTHYVANFAGGSAVLPDRTALFISDAEKPVSGKEYYNYTKHDYYAALFAYTPGSGRLQPRAIIRDFYGHTVSTGPALVQDTSNGRYHGRLYAAWSEADRVDTRFWLATSDDGGFKWSSRPILVGTSWHAAPSKCQRPTPDQIKLAIDRRGTLGVLWGLDGSRLLFSLSRDGGRSFSPVLTIANHGETPFTISDSVSFNEYWWDEVQTVNAGKWNDAVADISNLGLSVRMGQYPAVSDYALVADAHNAFHAIWGETDSEGYHGLYARTVIVSESPRGASGLLDRPAVSCAQANYSLHPPVPRPTLPVKARGQIDVSKSIVLQMQNVHFDRSTQTLSADVTFTNARKATIGHALSFVSVGLHSDYGSPVPLNATGNIQGQPYWDASSVIPKRGLAAHASSLPLRLQFKIADFHTLPGKYAASGGDAVAMRVFIYQKTGN
jgi:hypothetical protein